MSNKTTNTAIEFCIVVFSMVIAFLVFRNLDMETFIKPDDTPVTAVQIAASPSTLYPKFLCKFLRIFFEGACQKT